MPATTANEGTSPATAPAAPSAVKLQFAIKTALSLTLAYLIPMSMGWPQAQTAATTVMLIAATGALSESLQKGVLRIFGTIIGAILGLSLIALFPQDRMIYLVAVSVTVAIVIYLYNAYRGDSTIFMLTAVVTLMVFNGGDAEGAFLYGVDRAFMTAFGVIIYTLVASLLWPVKTADNTRHLAADIACDYHKAWNYLLQTANRPDSGLDDFLAKLLTDRASLQEQFARSKGHADGIADYVQEWNSVIGDYQELEALLVPALRQVPAQTVDFDRYLPNQQALQHNIERLFHSIDACWKGERCTSSPQSVSIDFQAESLRGERHLVIAAVAARVELLQKTQEILLDLLSALDSLLFDGPGPVNTHRLRNKSAFNWLDAEHFKTAARVFVTFWIATALWISFNPPGGFMFVTLCTVLVPLVSYTPATPKLLIILFTLGFAFAVPAYVFLLPLMTHWLELAAFLFAYAFIGFYIFQGPVTIFYMLGLFTLGIQNTMNYHFDGVMLIMLMLYMVCATLIISMYFPFSSKPARLYASLHRRFFRHCARTIRQLNHVHTSTFALPPFGDAAVLLEKMSTWSEKVEPTVLTDTGREPLATLNHACELLYGQLQVLALRSREFDRNPLIQAARKNQYGAAMAATCEQLASSGKLQRSNQALPPITDIESRLDELLGDGFLDRYDDHQLAQFYLYLNLQASIYRSIETCRTAQQALNWQRLGETQF